MAYQSAKNILPAKLLKEVQKYIDGDLVYIPSKSDKVGWGIRSGARQKYAERNREIRSRHRDGVSIRELADSYYLSADSIKKIVYGPAPSPVAKKQGSKRQYSQARNPGKCSGE